jgi:hypothetical protein
VTANNIFGKKAADKFFTNSITGHKYIRVELLQSFKFTGKTVKKFKFTDN